MIENTRSEAIEPREPEIWSRADKMLSTDCRLSNGARSKVHFGELHGLVVIIERSGHSISAKPRYPND